MTVKDQNIFKWIREKADMVWEEDFEQSAGFESGLIKGEHRGNNNWFIYRKNDLLFETDSNGIVVFIKFLLENANESIDVVYLPNSLTN